MNGPHKDGKRAGKSKRVSVSFKGVPSMTKQSFASGVQVDSVLKKYATLGVSGNDVGIFRAQSASMPYGVADLSYDFQANFNRVQAVKEYFGRLPSAVRDRFAHDPARMLAFMADPRNFDECVELGLLAKPAEPEKPKEEPKAPPPPPEKPAPK